MFIFACPNEIHYWFKSANYFTREVRKSQFPDGTASLGALKTLFRKFTVKALGTSNNPGYICVIRKENLVRVGFSRRPKNKLKKVRKTDIPQEMVWYGFTENMLTSKQMAMAHFSEYRTNGDWLKITPLMALTYLNGLTLIDSRQP